MRDLLLVAQECMKELDELAIPYRMVSEWKINTRAKKRWGQCKRLPNGTFEININVDLLNEKNSLKGLKETIIHELLHTCEGCMNHGKKWLSFVNEVNKYYGYNISRCSSAECKGVVVQRKAEKKYRYEIKCCKCSRSWKYQRMCHTIKCVELGWCKCCCGSNEFNVINL